MTESSSKDNLQRILELSTLLNKANHAYYVLDSPFLEDAVFDRLYRELLDLEKQNPSLIASESPTQRLGGPPSTGFKTIKHRIPLLSLDNAFNFFELKNWHSRACKSLEKSMPLVCELKIDGNALALSYANGILVRGATRGDGEGGEEITSNIKTISSIPLSLHLQNPPPWLEVRGEAFIPNLTFESINSERRESEKPLFANPRNACSGTLRQLDSRIVSSRHLDFFAYTIHLPEDWEPKKNDPSKPKCQWDALEWLKIAGFKINPNKKLIDDLEELEKFCLYWEKHRQDLAYATDGIVVKIDNFNLQNNLGVTQKAPKWAIALKFPAEEAPTKLMQLSFQVGRSGVITPVAEFQPIALAGTLVSRATLHNANRISTLDLHSNDTIVIRKAGEIIPEVVRVISELREPNSKKLCLPKSCPACKSQLVKDEAATKCLNNFCPAIICGGLRHWVSKGAMNIEGFGSKLIEQLVEKQLLQSIADLYKLELKQLEGMDRMGKKSSKKLLVAIEESKSKPWHKKLYGLGIPHIGEANAKAIAEVFLSSTELSNACLNSPSQISEIYGVGKEVLVSLQKWFSDSSKKELIASLNSLGITLQDTEIKKNPKKELTAITGKRFAITGTMSSLNRSEMQQLIENAGGKVNSSISSKTNYLIAGDKAGSKISKANLIGIKIINEKEFINLLNQ